MERTIRQKELAAEVMLKLGVKERYINKLLKNNSVCVFEDFGTFGVTNYPKQEATKMFLESKYKIFVYAITHDIINSKDVYSYLYIPHNRDSYNDLIATDGKNNIVNAYVIDRKYSLDGKFDSVMIEQRNGGIRRCRQ